MKTNTTISLLLTCVLVTSSHAFERPNIMAISTNGQEYQDLRRFDSPRFDSPPSKTPHVDRIDSEGVRVSNFYARAVRSPSRATFMSDSYPLRVSDPGGHVDRLYTVAQVEPGDKVRHSFIAFGQSTYIVDDRGMKTWTYPHATRDGFVLAGGDIVLALNKGRRHKGGAVIRIAPGGKESLIWKGTQAEVNGVHPTRGGTFVITEAGPKPRLLEVNAEGNVVLEFPLQCQMDNFHLQTRMARKLANGTYLVPHLLDFAVRNYAPDGKVLSSIDTSVKDDPQRDIHTWPFTAIRHGNGHTLVCCTNGNRVADFDERGNIAWQLTNDDLPGPWLQDPCGGQVLPNGNIVIASYAGGRKNPKAPKLIEVNRDKEVIWTYSDGQKVGIHHFQILDTGGIQLDGEPLK